MIWKSQSFFRRLICSANFVAILFDIEKDRAEPSAKGHLPACEKEGENGGVVVHWSVSEKFFKN